jgi:excisionase family DNA binding protein
MFSEADEAIPPLALVLGGSRPLLVHHVAQRLRISRRTVRHLAETGKLRGFKPGRKIWYFLPVDVDRLRAQREARCD